jgi:RimJ/RimL family protein N-acetyltransferase
MSVAVAPRSYLCPPGWAGIVVIGSATLATAPDHDTARFIEQALSGQPAAWLTDTGVLSSRLPAAEILGPASLAYLDPAEFRPQPGDAVTTPVGLDHPGFRQFLLAAGTDDVAESGIGKITTPAFAIREHGQVVAAAGYRDWPCGTAHLSELTASAARGRGLAQAAASAAVAHAIAEGRLPQWRARPQASRRVARALGFRELGAQVSIRLAAAVTSREHRRLRAERMDRRLVTPARLLEYQLRTAHLVLLTGNAEVDQDDHGEHEHDDERHKTPEHGSGAGERGEVGLPHHHDARGRGDHRDD